MTYRPRAACKACGAKRRDGNHISRSGLCVPCGIDRFSANLTELRDKSGPYYSAWLEGITDAIARLWVVPQTPQQIVEAIPAPDPQEDVSWLAGRLQRRVTLTIPYTTSSCSSTSGTCWAGRSSALARVSSTARTRPLRTSTPQRTAPRRPLRLRPWPVMVATRR